MGKLIVIDGVDGSGKQTQTKRLEEHLKGEGVNCLRVDFPRYGQKSATLVEGYLHGELGSRPDDTGAYASSLFYAMDRYWSYRTDDWGKLYDEGGTVICDRYTTANAIHQCAKLPESMRDDYLNWLWDIEYNKIGIPKPDKIIFLDMEPRVYEKLIDRRSASEDRKKDIHELDSDYLLRSYHAALYACEKLGWTHIKCYDGSDPRDPDSIFADILTALNDIF